MRSASVQMSDEIFANYSASIESMFYIQTLLVACIGMFLVIVGTMLLIPNVFEVMKTTKLVLALFGMINKEDIKTLSEKCEKFNEELLNEIEKKKLQDKDRHDTKTADAGAKPVVDKDKVLDASDVRLEQKQVPLEDEPFDIKTEKPN